MLLEPLHRSPCPQGARPQTNRNGHMLTLQGKVVMYIDEHDSPSESPIGDSVLMFHVQALPGGFTRFSYKTAAGDEDRQVIDVSEILEKITSTSES